jgi:hypothetical protein
MSPSTGFAWLHRHHVALLSIALPFLVLLVLGADRNWDLRNYHFYNAHAWVTGRYAIDIAAAQLQSWHNPTLDLPFYFLVRADAPSLLVAAWLMVPLCIAIACLLTLYRRLAGGFASVGGSVAVAVLAVLGTGATSANGTTFNDAFVAAAMLGALVLVTTPTALLRHWLWAGLIGGAMAGLKLTSAPYCIALAAVALLAAPWRVVLMRLAVLGSGGLAGFLLTFGAWGWEQWQAHANPLFPYFNHLFQSPDVAAVPWTDDRFRPSAWWQMLLTPFRLLDKTRAFSEASLRDPRLLIGFLSLGWLLWKTRGEQASVAKRTLWTVAMFFLVSYVLWAYLYGIYRYALPLEMLSCALAVVALARIRLSRPRTMLVVACVVVIALTRQPNWGRGSFNDDVLRVELPQLPPASLVVLSSQEPLGFAVATLPGDVPAISIYNNMMRPTSCQGLQVAAEQRLRSHDGPLWLLRTEHASDDEGERVLAEAYGTVVAGECRRVETSFGPLRLCPLSRPSRPLTCG